MLKQFKSHLLRIYLLTTASLFLLLLVILFWVNRNQYSRNNIAKFEDHVKTVTEELISENSVSYEWLSKMEAKYQLLIFVSSNSIPISFEGSWTPLTNRQVLLERFCSLINENEEENNSIYSIYGDKGEHYYGYAFSKGAYQLKQEIVILQWIQNEESDRQKQIVFFLFLSVVALLAVYLISRLLVKISLQPLKEGLTRQNEFIAAASHELRSPLTVIMAGIGNLKLDHSVKEEIIPCMEQEGKRMAKLIQDMLLIASSDAKTWNLNLEEVEPETILIHIYESLAQICRKKDQKPELSLPEEELPKFLCDRLRLEQVLIILADNACSYSPANSIITIEALEYKKYIRIKVIDHGKGIPEEEKKRIFERFYRSDSSRNEKTHFGLGLSIATELIYLHKGRLWVEDTLGGGSTFVIELPIHLSKK